MLAFKGGNTYTTGGATAGTWTQPDHAHGDGNLAGPSHTHDGPSHNHQVYEYTASSTDDKIYRSDGTQITLTISNKQGQVKSILADQASVNKAPPDLYTSLAGTGATGAGGTGAVTGTTASNATPNTYRPAAAVGTLQYLDL